MTGSRRLALAVAVLLVFGAAPAWPDGAAGPPTPGAIRALLEKGEGGEALEQATLALEYAPEDAALLELGSLAAEAAGRPDDALWLAKLSRQAAVSSGAPARIVKAADARVTALEKLEPAERAAFSDAVERIFDLGRTCVRRKLYANAVELLSRFEGTPHEAAAGAELEKLYGSKKVVQALLDSGLDVPVTRDEKRSAAWIARNNEKHADWKNAWRIKSDNYTVLTNVDWALARAVNPAMEQMNRFYREVFFGKERGGGAARCTIHIYKNREEYLANVSDDMHDAAGFFVPGENRVSTHDTRPEGESIAEFWATLYHEASHQFTNMIFAGDVPCWLDEGTASYFEGARLMPGGRVERNLVVDYYLAAARPSLEKGEPSLEDVVRYASSESYDAEYYPVGWALVYFLLNYEDERSNRIYAPRYAAYLDSYRTGGKHDRFERFLEYFVTKPKSKGVTSFEEFDERFRTWCFELHDMHFGGAEMGERFLERARRQRKAGKLDAAIASYRSALDKQPRSVVGLLELAELYADEGRKDSAIATYRRVLRVVRRSPLDQDVEGKDGTTGAELVATVFGRIRKLDKLVANGLDAAATALAVRATDTAQEYAEKDMPRCALHALDQATLALGPRADVVALRAELAERHEVEVRRRRRLPVLPGLEDWQADAAWSAKDGVLVGRTDTGTVAVYGSEPPDRWRFEATFRATSDPAEVYFGIVFGLGDDGVLDVFGSYGDADIAVQRLAKDWERLLEFPDLPEEEMKVLRFTLDVDGGDVVFSANGKKLGRRHYPEGELRGRLGVILADGGVEVRDAVLVY